MKLSYNYDHTTVQCNLIEKRFLKNLLAARPDGFQFSPKFKKGFWDGFISLYDSKLNCFPSGLITYVLNGLKAEAYEYELTGHAELLPLPVLPVAGYTYRDYQYKAIELALIHRRGVLKLATNAGKTLVIAGILMSSGCMGLVVVPSRALLIQTADELESMLGMKVGRVGDKYNDIRDVTVTTIASLEKVAKSGLLVNNRAVVLDETHHAKANSVYDHVFSVPGDIRIGTSGTPLSYQRLLDLKLVAATGELLYEVTNADLIEGGHSSKPLIKFIVIDTPTIKAKKADYQIIYRKCIVDNYFRNEIIAMIAESEVKRGPVLVLCDWVQHVMNIVQIAGFKYATGQTSNIKKVLNDFETLGGVLVASPIFGEGVNIPSLSTIIMASSNESHIKTLQNIGRGLRMHGAGVVHVYDFLDGTNKHLLKHSEHRLALYKEEGFQVELL